MARMWPYPAVAVSDDSCAAVNQLHSVAGSRCINTRRRAESFARESALMPIRAFMLSEKSNRWQRTTDESMPSLGCASE